MAPGGSIACHVQRIQGRRDQGTDRDSGAGLGIGELFKDWSGAGLADYCRSHVFLRSRCAVSRDSGRRAAPWGSTGELPSVVAGQEAHQVRPRYLPAGHGPLPGSPPAGWAGVTGSPWFAWR